MSSFNIGHTSAVDGCDRASDDIVGVLLASYSSDSLLTIVSCWLLHHVVMVTAVNGHVYATALFLLLHAAA